MNRNLLIRIGVPNVARLWSGSGDLYLPADGIETVDRARYLGGGEILDGLTDVEQLLNGTAARLDLSVSGVTLETVRLAKEEFVAGALVDIGIVEFDDLWQLIAVTWTAQYRADKLSVDRGEGQRTITISMGSDDTGRSSSPMAYFTDADQRRRSPTDRFFERVAGLNAGTSRQFGPRG